MIEHSLRIANVLKLNDAELTVLAGMFELGPGLKQQIQDLARMRGIAVDAAIALAAVRDGLATS